MSFRNYYDSTYSRNRDTSRSHVSDRPTTVTAKYLSPSPTYKSSNIPILNREKSATRDVSPISTIANKYASYNKKDENRSPKYDKKDYTKLTVPTITTSRSRDVSPISTSSKYSHNRSSRHSPEIKRVSPKGRSPDPTPKEREKDIPSKTDKSSSYNSLNNYKLYSRNTSLTRPTSRIETKPDIIVNRYAIANRLSNNYLKSPVLDKSRSSVSPVSYTESYKSEKSVSPVITIENDKSQHEEKSISQKEPSQQNTQQSETLTVITRHTSPTPPGSSAYVRNRRADMAKTIEKTIPRPKTRPEMVDKEVQSDRLDDPTRSLRFAGAVRPTSGLLSLYTPSSNTSYTGYAGRYSTQYANVREPSIPGIHERSSRSRSTEPIKENSTSISTEDTKEQIQNSQPKQVLHYNQEMVTSHEQNKDDDTSEIIINVNLKLKKAKSPSTELVSPEITITNCQLPPQAPKSESSTKVKKIKTRKGSTDSSSDSSSKKKVVKKRSNSVSSTDSDGTSNDKNSVSPPKSVTKTSPKKKVQNGKVKQLKSRESNSPESIISTQSSISEDDSVSKSKTNDLSRTSADETSLPTDKSTKQTGSGKNENVPEDAKSFLIRALAPVTNLFRGKSNETNDSKWSEHSASESTSKDISNLVTESDRSKSRNNTDDIVASNDDNVVKLKAIRHIESGERAWWLESDSEKKNDNSSGKIFSEKSMPRKIRRIESGERAWWLDANGSSKSSSQPQESPERSLRKANYSDDDKPWWLDNNANIPEGIECLTPPRKSSGDSDRSEKYDFFKVRHIESGEKKDWWATSNENSSNSKQDSQSSDQKSFPLRRIRHVDSGERPWWLSSSQNIPEGIEKLPTPSPQQSSSSESEEVQNYVAPVIPPFPLEMPHNEPLGDRRSPEGLETPREDEQYNRGRSSPYENNHNYRRRSSVGLQNKSLRFISRYMDIDDILGTSGHVYSPFMDSILARRIGHNTIDDEDCEEIDPTQVRIHDSTAQMPVIRKVRGSMDIVDYREKDQVAAVHRLLQAPHRLDDVALQVFKDGEYGPYLDLDSTLCEQEEDIEGLQDSRKNAIVMRTQLSVRVHALIERLQCCQGKDLRRALFSLKQIFQSDGDLVHEFMQNNGLDCLVRLGNTQDHNFLDYVLRALGQILLYVDGMHGVMSHPGCVQWLYSLVSSMYRHVVKTALKLLLIFVEYTEQNSLLLIQAIRAVDNCHRRSPWHNIMTILQDVDASDTELLIYATSLINRCLNNVQDRNMYYDNVDALLDQGMDEVIQLYMSKQGTDLDLLRQLQIFEAVLMYEDGDETGTALKQLDESIITSIRRRSLQYNSTTDRRKSKKQLLKGRNAEQEIENNQAADTTTANTNQRKSYLPSLVSKKENNDTRSATRKRRDRFTRQAHHITQQQELINNSFNLYNGFLNNYKTNGSHIPFLKKTENGNGQYQSDTKYDESNTQDVEDGEHNYLNGATEKKEEESSLIKQKMKELHLAEVLANGNQRYTAGLKHRIQNGTLGHSVSAIDALTVIRQKQLDIPDNKEDRNIVINKEHTIKDIAQRLTTLPITPTTEEKVTPNRVADMVGIVSKAKEELAKSQSKEIVKSSLNDFTQKDVKKSETELHWEQLKQGCINRAFHLCDLDFSDLVHDSDEELFGPTPGGMPPPPPPPSLFPLATAPPPPPGPLSTFPRAPVPAPPPKPPHNSDSLDSDNSTYRKNKKTVKLFWKEIHENPLPANIKSKIGGFVWDDLPEIHLDTNKLEHLFESKSNDLIIKEKISEPKRNLVLDTKRSNAINIAMKKLPTPQTIKAAILKMDATVFGREGIEKLLTVLPTEEEIIKIQEAQYANPDLPLGSAEQFLITFASITELTSRLMLWVFKLDFDNTEKEIAEPLMDLKQGLELLKMNRTFKAILSTLRSVGSFLNGNAVKGFRLEYLAKVTEVKDTVHKHPLLYHICEIIIEKFPESTDLFSEVGPVIRASKVDFDALNANLNKLECDCKASWDHMKRVAKHDGAHIHKTKINEFLTDAAERIILLSCIKKRVMSRYNKFLLYIGVPPGDIDKTKPSIFLKVIAEFALEYRTTRERVLMQLERRANHRERNKTRGKMITEVTNYTNKNGNDVSAADIALKKLLKDDNDLSDGRRRNNVYTTNGDHSAEDEMIKSLVSSSGIRTNGARERRKNRASDNKKYSNRRTISPSQQPWSSREASAGYVK